ncbi:MAG: Ppx/GppA phosphatase family protein [Hyphomicrobiaceae bacterium]
MADQPENREDDKDEPNASSQESPTKPHSQTKSPSGKKRRRRRSRNERAEVNSTGGEQKASAGKNSSQQKKSSRRPVQEGHSILSQEVYGALDLGTNNCRLLLAQPTRRGFRVVDAFSRIIRLGEGVSRTGRLSDGAMQRTDEALRVCASKMRRLKVKRARLVATEACRIAENGQDFLERIHLGTGLKLEILSREMEARLAVSGCASLIDAKTDFVLVFDIGGGSSEIIWLDLNRATDKNKVLRSDRSQIENAMLAWTSLPVGVVTLSEKFGGRLITPDVFEAMVAYVMDLVRPFEQKHRISERIDGQPMHFLGTSGTVTTLAGVQLGLPRYDRARVDGCWLNVDEARGVTSSLLAKTFDQRVQEPCIGAERADLVMAGCAILEGLIRLWPCERLRVADRGLREGILTTLMTEDGVFRSGRRRRRGRSGRRRRSGSNNKD